MIMRVFFVRALQFPLYFEISISQNSANINKIYKDSKYLKKIIRVN